MLHVVSPAQPIPPFPNPITAPLCMIVEEERMKKKNEGLVDEGRMKTKTEESRPAGRLASTAKYMLPVLAGRRAVGRDAVVNAMGFFSEPDGCLFLCLLFSLCFPPPPHPDSLITHLIRLDLPFLFSVYFPVLMLLPFFAVLTYLPIYIHTPLPSLPRRCLQWASFSTRRTSPTAHR
ncbi:hypothetical protein C8R43DRAFT_69090 [Mycena crocata]|nr:hypothetical protein C8R43DRAFT_69090 [Mycena crocata]